MINEKNMNLTIHREKKARAYFYSQRISYNKVRMMSNENFTHI